MLGKALAQAREDRAGFIHGQRGLRYVGDPLGVVDLQSVHVALALHEHDLLRGLAHRAFHLLVSIVTHEHDRVALLGEAHGLAVHLRHQRAGGVDRAQAARLRACAHARGDAVGGEHAHRALGHLALLLDKDRAALAQPGDDVLVVHDLLAHIHRRTVDRQRAFHGLHGAIHAGAVSAGCGEENLLDRVGHQRHCRGAGVP